MADRNRRLTSAVLICDRLTPGPLRVRGVGAGVVVDEFGWIAELAGVFGTLVMVLSSSTGLGVCDCEMSGDVGEDMNGEDAVPLFSAVVATLL